MKSYVHQMETIVYVVIDAHAMCVQFVCVSHKMYRCPRSGDYIITVSLL
jgi:hypothetical protein